jgi:hypothetical protein
MGMEEKIFFWNISFQKLRNLKLCLAKFLFNFFHLKRKMGPNTIYDKFYKKKISNLIL